MNEFKGTKGRHQIMFSNNVCIGIGVKIDVDYYHMTANTILPDTDKEYAKNKQEIEANMRLYSAAPELLEALQDLVRFCQDNEVGAELDLANYVINKALGK